MKTIKAKAELCYDKGYEVQENIRKNSKERALTQASL